ncbi:MAG: BrnA antitoxin family protein [Chloroflexota bacterium]|jgi:uncharacterized protein (DUF4415 family)
MKQGNLSQILGSDLARLDAMTDEDIDLSDSPEVTPEMFAKAIVRRGLKPVVKKKQITLRIDDDVIIWFKSQGEGYQTHINQLLREYVKVQKAQASKLQVSK